MYISLLQNSQNLSCRKKAVPIGAAFSYNKTKPQEITCGCTKIGNKYLRTGINNRPENYYNANSLGNFKYFTRNSKAVVPVEAKNKIQILNFNKSPKKSILN